MAGLSTLCILTFSLRAGWRSLLISLWRHTGRHLGFKRSLHGRRQDMRRWLQLLLQWHSTADDVSTASKIGIEGSAGVGIGPIQAKVKISGEVALGFEMLPSGVTAGTTSATTVNITDDDDLPRVRADRRRPRLARTRGALRRGVGHGQQEERGDEEAPQSARSPATNSGAPSPAISSRCAPVHSSAAYARELFPVYTSPMVMCYIYGGPEVHKRVFRNPVLSF